ncbi:hypothetical protein MSAN_01234500 [Mycena sanguinolenta]|uniref:Uncharacterized protein n=1 Tax=Mycena sanguinolenta TaxID=230812 RepID=A0A8H6YIK4_9AGAR|nr:hypothetical protein MSAN_01234500 [Mycena sanguinolenta]
MAITLDAKQPKAPFIDSSNRTPTKRHAHLRSSSASSPLSKSPPTCTLSLASVTTNPLLSFPLSPPSCVPFPSDDSACGDDASVSAEPWRRPRARTSHVETPRSQQAPPKHRRNRVSKQPTPSSSGSCDRITQTAASTKVPTPADLRLAALVERSIELNLASRPPRGVGADWSISILDQQDSLLAARLRVLLTRHGRRVRPPSPSGFVPAAAPASVLLSGTTSSGVCVDIVAPPPTPTPGLRFVASTRPSRSRSSSRGSTHAAELEMPALVATLLLRRHEGGAGTLVLRRHIKRAVLPPSPLGTHILSPSGGYLRRQAPACDLDLDELPAVDLITPPSSQLWDRGPVGADQRQSQPLYIILHDDLRLAASQPPRHES